jgi:hypothetical protein
MPQLRFLLVLFACAWLLAALWLVLMARLLNQLCNQDPAAYETLGRPQMRWLWWSWPTPERALAPRLFHMANGRVDVSTLYSIDELASLARLVIWIALDRPKLELTRATKCQQRQLRVCGLGFLLCLGGVVLLAVLGSG